jgi:NADPH:quinone reductase-like Zn-dependent oxidoreductase
VTFQYGDLRLTFQAIDLVRGAFIMASPSSSPASMLAWQFTSTEFGLEKNLQLNQAAPIPALLAHDTVTFIKVLCVSLNPVDYKLAELPLVGKCMVPRPATPGSDYLGRVVKTTVKGLKDGDLVFGTFEVPQKHGTLAEFVVVKGEEGVVKVPEGFLGVGKDGRKLDELACVGVAGLTALQSLKHVTLGKTIFINGGSGGTGTFAIQFAKHVLGCEAVVTSCSRANVGLVKELGADDVINYEDQDVINGLQQWVQRSGKKFDVIVDNVGNSPDLYWQAHRYLEESGNFVQVGTPQLNLSFALNLMKMMLWPRLLGGGKRNFSMVTVKAKKEDLEKIARWMKEVKVKAVIDETYRMEDVPKAFEKLRMGRTRGKIVITVSEDAT